MAWVGMKLETLEGSYSAVSTPIFASKYALESSRRDLHNALLCTVLQSQFFRQKSPKLFRDWINEYSLIHSQTLRILRFLARIFDEFFSGFRAKFQKIVTCVAFSIKFAKTNQKFAENSEFCEKNSLLLVNYSLHSLSPRRLCDTPRSARSVATFRWFLP